MGSSGLELGIHACLEGIFQHFSTQCLSATFTSYCLQILILMSFSALFKSKNLKPVDILHFKMTRWTIET